MTRNQRGFTLIEVVVAMAILAVISIMAWQGMDLVLRANARSEGDLARELRLQATWQMIENDLIHLRPRGFQDGLGGIEPAFQTGTDEIVLRFTRGGEAGTTENPAGLTRVEYILEDEVLYRDSRPAHLSPREGPARRRRLLQGVQALSFSQPDAQNYFAPFWPPLNERRAIESLPPMIRVTLTLVDGSTTTQSFPGVHRAR